MTGHIILIDASGFAYRAFHAHNEVRRKSDDMPIHAILGFMAITWRTMGRASADPYTHIASVFDFPGKTFRHKIYPAYKGQRVRHASLTEQLPLLREASRSMGVEPIEMEGFEADDVIATMATRAKAIGMRTTIVSVDKDFGGLVEDGIIELADPVKHTRVLAKQVEEEFGVPPRLVPDIQALTGDTVDNIPGIPGVGPKTALELLNRFGSFDALLKAIDADKPGKTRSELWRKLKKGRADLPLYHKLVTLRTDVPLDFDFASFEPQAIHQQHLRDMLHALEADSHFDNLFGHDKKLFRQAEPVKDAYAWWRTELSGKGPKTLPETPQCGWYKRRLVQGGHWVACRIWRDPEYDMDRPTGKETLCCEVAGERDDPVKHWSALWQHPITEAEYRKMLDLARAFKEHSPNSSLANPRTPIDWNKESLD